VPRPDEQPRAADDELALLDVRAALRRHPAAVDARAVPRAQVAHVHAAILEQRQERVLRRRVLVVHDEVAVEVAPDAAFRAGAREALAQDRVAVRAKLLDHHHGFHCRAPR
jgi:hypothetical protein